MDKQLPPLSSQPASGNTSGDFTSVYPSASSAVPSSALLGIDGILEILHEGQIYRLRRTSTGKLILTK